jgi:hypothetical protein
MFAKITSSAILVVLFASVCVSKSDAAAYDFSGQIQNPNATIPAGDYGNLVGDGSFWWQTGTTSIDVETNGFIFTLNSGDGNNFNYGGVISGGGDVHFLMGPVWNGFANNPMYVSGPNSNTYTGVSYVRYGRVEMIKPDGVNALPGDVVVGGQGDNDRLRWGQNNQVADSASISMLGNFVATLDLNGYTETVNEVNLAANSIVETGDGGILNVSSLIFDGAPLGPGQYDSSNPFVLGTGFINVAAAGVPEPGTLILAALGALGLGWTRRRRPRA